MKNSDVTKELSPIERAAVAFVKLIQANEQPKGSPIESFETNLFEDERLAWHDLTAAIAGWEILYGE